MKKKKGYDVTPTLASR